MSDKQDWIIDKDQQVTLTNRYTCIEVLREFEKWLEERRNEQVIGDYQSAIDQVYDMLCELKSKYQYQIAEREE